jgi:Fur family transcriptional regulator, stress-responsive regulator
MEGRRLIERLQSRADWRMTAQRRVIAQALDGDHIHLTAEQIFQRARQHLPELSLATVYNTLNELVALGELQQMDVAGGPTRYDPNTEHRHDHLVCLRCGEVHDVFPRGKLQLPASQRFGHRIVGQDTVFKGYCPKCVGSEPSRADAQPSRLLRP